MVLTDGSGIVAFPVVQVSSYKYPEGSDAASDREGPVETALARYFEFPYGTRGVHVTELTFDEAGYVGRGSECSAAGWERGDDRGCAGGSRSETMSVDLGEVPPLVDSRTLAGCRGRVGFDDGIATG